MTIDEQRPPAQRRQPRGVGRPIRLQERDLDVCRSLSEGRYLTVPAIEWLHWPTWRERYKGAASLPASARIAQIQNSGTTVGNIVLSSSGTLQLRNGSTTIGSVSGALGTNTLYRIGLHQKKGAGTDGVLEAFVATGDAAFGTPFASSTSQSFTSQATKFVFAATNSNFVDATFDDIKLDSAAMPGPSGGGVSPTATPTNTPVATATNTPTATPTGPTATATPVPTAPPAYDISMTYDALGNLTSKTGVGVYGYGVNGNGTGAGPHQVRNIGGNPYTYDANGNMSCAHDIPHVTALGQP